MAASASDSSKTRTRSKKTLSHKEALRAKHLRVLNFWLRTQTSEWVERRCPVDLLSLILKFSVRILRGEKMMGYDKATWSYVMRHYEDYEDDNCFPGIRDSYSIFSVSCCDFCQLKFPAKARVWIIDDCNSSRLEFAKGPSMEMQVMNCLGTTIEIGSRVQLISLDACENVRLVLPAQTAKHLAILTSATYGVDIDWKYKPEKDRPERTVMQRVTIKRRWIADWDDEQMEDMRYSRITFDHGLGGEIESSIQFHL